MDEQQNPNMQSGSNPNTPTEPNFANGIEYDAPAQPIISSAPEPQENVQQTNASKFFGGRSRASQIAASTPTTNYRQNAPEFFSQAMNQGDTIMQEVLVQRKKNKKHLKILGITLGAVLLVCGGVLGIFAILKNQTPAGLMPADKIELALSRENIEKINDVETYFENIYNSKIAISEITREGEVEKIGAYVDNYENTYNIIREYTIADEKGETKEDFAKAKSIMAKMIPTYRGYLENIKIIQTSLEEKDASKISGLTGVNSEVIEKLSKYINALVLQEEFVASCSSQRESGIFTGRCLILNEQLSQADEGLLRDKGIVKKIVFGDQVLDDGFSAYSSLNSIYAKLENKK